MNAALIALCGARFYWRTHLGVVLGSALGAMVLIGALLVGDSVKATLRHQALLRVGMADAALVSGDRFFRQHLADDTDDSVVGGAVGRAAPVLLFRGSVSRADGSARVNQAQVLGVEERFWSLAPRPATALRGEELALNARAAAQLGAKVGDTIILRVEKPGAFSRDAPLSGEESEVIAIRAPITRILADEEFGRFSLSASQVPPFAVFVRLELLQEKLAFPGKANLLLAGHPEWAPTRVRKGPGPNLMFTRAATSGLLRRVSAKWKIEDAALELRELPNGAGTELRTSRVFLDAPVVKAAPRGLDSLTYLVNELRFGEKATPYSMVTAIDAPSSGFLPAELSDNEIVVSQWLADDLGVKLNERITLKYYVMGERRQLEEKAREFEVIGILPMNERNLNGTWMPDFPGLTDKENCRDWQPGFAIDTTKFRDQDEKYWDEFRGTPKAFINISIGQEMWGNRWGNLTSIRYPEGTAPSAIAEPLRANLTPEQIGLQVVPLREQALAATDAPVDFGQLFVSFSFFLIAAAAVLTGLLFVFTLEQRNAEAGTLLALGLPPKLVRRMLLGEGALLALLGTGLGLCGAFLFTWLVLRGLGTVWRGAVGAVDFQFSATPASLIGGAVGSLLVALLAMWLASRRQLRQSARELLSGEKSGVTSQGRAAQWTARLPLLLLVAAFLGGGALLLFVNGPAAFFGAGALLLIGGLSLAMMALRRAARGTQTESLGALGMRNAARRRGRSLATIAVLASGVFMVVAVDSFRHRARDENAPLDPGTGGFALVGESALPIYEDLNTPAGREAYGLDETAMAGVSIVPMRVRDGDDASCLNLNRALHPRLLGVKPAELANRDAFRFADGEYFGDGEPATQRPLTAKNWWPALAGADRDDAVPGIVDANTLQWALQMKLGDTLEYKDERGQPFRVRFVATVGGSILQGAVLISEEQFVSKFPGSGGYRSFLIQAPAPRMAEVSEQLSRALEDRGLELTPAARRLAEFQAVENTYLSIFQVLGGLGLLLGSAGLAIVVARNVLERRREFGLLEAVGFRPGQLRAMVFAEHRWLIVAALAIGTFSALVAVWPSLAAKSGGFPWREMTLLLAALALGCVFWTWIATRLALRGSAIAALRAE